MRTPYIRVTGEAFDADPVAWSCETCGRDEYSCDCEGCDHHSFVRFGQLECRHCGWIYRIGMAGSRWVDPNEDQLDMQPLSVMLAPDNQECR